MKRILTTMAMAAALVVTMPGVATAGTSYLGNTCAGTARLIKYTKADKNWFNLGCGGVLGGVVIVSSEYPFRLKNNRGSEVCWRARSIVAVDPNGTVEHVNAWTVRSC